MRIGIQTWGTEGDVRPFFSLAAALKTRGHAVKVVYTNVEGRDFGPLAERCGVEAIGVAGEYFRDNASRNAKRAQESFERGNPLSQIRLIAQDLLDPVVQPMFEAGAKLATESDAMVGHFIAHPAATAAELHRVPYGIVSLQPIFASAHYAPVGMPAFPRWLNPIKWKLVARVLESVFRDRINALRAHAGLSPVRDVHRLSLERSAFGLVAVSPTLFPRPPDWATGAHVCGFLGLPDAAEDWQPDAELRAFLDRGPAPAFLSFGSMFSLDGDRTNSVVAKLAHAVELAGARGIIQAPESVIAHAPKSDAIAYVVRAPHARLFPCCSMIVHHGGAGTTQSALLAGRPSIVVPHAADQFYWGELLFDRGVASKPLAARSLTPKALAERIRFVASRPELTTRATALGDALRDERGPERAAELVERAFLGMLAP